MGCDTIFLPSQEIYKSREVENIFNTDICSRGKKIKQNRKRTSVKNNLFLRYCLQQMNSTGKWLTFAG